MKRVMVVLAMLICGVGLSAQVLSAQAPHSVALSWTWTQGTGGQCSDFLVSRGTVSGGPYTLIDTTTACSTLTYTDTASTTNILVEGQTYYYVVQAQNPGNTSADSTQASGTIPYTAPVA